MLVKIVLSQLLVWAAVQCEVVNVLLMVPAGPMMVNQGALMHAIGRDGLAFKQAIENSGGAKDIQITVAQYWSADMAFYEESVNWKQCLLRIPPTKATEISNGLEKLHSFVVELERYFQSSMIYSSVPLCLDEIQAKHQTNIDYVFALIDQSPRLKDEGGSAKLFENKVTLEYLEKGLAKHNIKKMVVLYDDINFWLKSYEASSMPDKYAMVDLSKTKKSLPQLILDYVQ